MSFQDHNRRIAELVLPEGTWVRGTELQRWTFGPSYFYVYAGTNHIFVDVSLVMFSNMRFSLSDPDCIETAKEYCDDLIQKITKHFTTDVINADKQYKN